MTKEEKEKYMKLKQQDLDFSEDEETDNNIEEINNT